MLTFKESYVMEYVYQKCQGKKSCLISPREIISFCADKYVLMPDELEKIMTNLSYDNYIELFKSDKKGKRLRFNNRWAIPVSIIITRKYFLLTSAPKGKPFAAVCTTV